MQSTIPQRETAKHPGGITAWEPTGHFQGFSFPIHLGRAGFSEADLSHLTEAPSTDKGESSPLAIQRISASLSSIFLSSPDNAVITFLKN